MKLSLIYFWLLIYRQSHQTFFQKSDLFFICMLRPLSHDIRKQDLEIEAAQVCVNYIRYVTENFPLDPENVL